jgi:2-aminoadipate transaminase
VVTIPSTPEGICLDTLQAKLEAGLRPRLVYVIPTHSNPGGCTLPAHARARLVQLAHTHSFLVVADEAYHLLGWGHPPPPRFARLDAEHIQQMEGEGAGVSWKEGRGAVGALSLGSFTKILAPSMRLGWVEGEPRLLKQV